MPVSKANQRAVAKYEKANYDDVRIRVQKGRREEIKAHATRKGESLNGFVNRAIENQVERDLAEQKDEKGGEANVTSI